MKKMVIVKMGEQKITDNNIKLMATLGSCIAIVLFDKNKNIFGLSHILLPHIKKKNNENAEKYANTAIPILIENMIKKGAKKQDIKAKIAGGAKMEKVPLELDFEIGKKNIIAVEKSLKKNKIEIISKDVGGKTHRSVSFNPDTCELNIHKGDDILII